MVFRGYIDESYDDDIFTLSCLIAKGTEWMWFSRDWKRCIERWNKALKKQGRKPIQRYHAADCSSLENDFFGWTVQEQRQFTSDLLTVFKKHPTETVAYSIDRAEFLEVFPGIAKPNARGVDLLGNTYGLMTKMLVLELAHRYCDQNPVHLTLIHDRCRHDGVIADAFNQLLCDPGFARFQHFFTTIAPMSWEHCLPLQPADLVAYENFKEAMRKLHPRKRRKSLELMLDLGSFGGVAQLVRREGLIKIRDGIHGPVTTS